MAGGVAETLSNGAPLDGGETGLPEKIADPTVDHRPIDPRAYRPQRHLPGRRHGQEGGQNAIAGPTFDHRPGDVGKVTGGA